MAFAFQSMRRGTYSVNLLERKPDSFIVHQKQHCESNESIGKARLLKVGKVFLNTKDISNENRSSFIYKNLDQIANSQVKFKTIYKLIKLFKENDNILKSDFKKTYLSI